MPFLILFMLRLPLGLQIQLLAYDLLQIKWLKKQKQDTANMNKFHGCKCYNNHVISKYQSIYEMNDNNETKTLHIIAF